MDQMKEGLKNYLSETSLHGFKYLQLNNRKPLTRFWALVIIFCFSYSSLMIKESYDDWNDNPIITTVEEFGTSLNHVDFPTVTICHEPKYQPDNWVLPEMILNFFAFDCWNKDVLCQATENIRNDFGELVEYVFDVLDDTLTDSNVDLDKVSEALFDNKTKNYLLNVKPIWNIILANHSSTKVLKKIIKKGFKKFGGSGVQPFNRLLYFQRYISSLKAKQFNDCKKNCQSIRNYVSSLLLMAYSLASSEKEGTLGTFFRHFASEMGKTFQTYGISPGSRSHISVFEATRSENGDIHYVREIPTSLIPTLHFDCNDLQKQEILFHEIMTKVSLALGSNGSLFDFPNFFKVEPYDYELERPISTYPIYSWCKYGKILASSNQFQHEQEGFVYCPQQWSKILENSEKPDDHPYVQDPQGFCSKSTKDIIGDELKIILKVMKFAHHLHNIQDIKFIYDKVKASNLPYQMVPFEILNTSEFQSKIQKPFIMEGSHFTNDEFLPTITNLGLCYAWNGKRLSEVYKGSKFIKTFENEFIKDEIKEPIKKASMRKFTIYLDKQESTFPDRIKSTKSFWLGLTSTKDFFDMTGTPFPIPRGFKTVLKVRPTSIESDTAIRGIDVDIRKCLFADEFPFPFKIIQEYSASACHFECMFDFSLKECMCIPWDMPRPDGTKTKICDFAGNQCFHSKMTNSSYEEESCKCYPSCDNVQYSFQLESQQPINIERECSSNYRGYEYVKDKLAPDLEMLKDILNLDEGLHDWKNMFDRKKHYFSELAMKKCKEIFTQDVAIIEIKMEKQSLIKMKKSLKYNMTIKLGTIGGTMGLFTGFSFMALVEIFYWIIITLTKVLKQIWFHKF